MSDTHVLRDACVLRDAPHITTYQAPMHNWGFAFFFPISLCAAAGVALMGLFTSAACSGARVPPLQTVYAVTPRRVVILTANPRDRVVDKRASVQSYAAHTLYSVTRSGDSVTFCSPGHGVGRVVTDCAPKAGSAGLRVRRQALSTGPTLDVSANPVTLCGLTDQDVATVFGLLQQRVAASPGNCNARAPTQLTAANTYASDVAEPGPCLYTAPVYVPVNVHSSGT